MKRRTRGTSGTAGRPDELTCFMVSPVCRPCLHHLYLLPNPGKNRWHEEVENHSLVPQLAPAVGIFHVRAQQIGRKTQVYTLGRGKTIARRQGRIKGVARHVSTRRG